MASLSVRASSLFRQALSAVGADGEQTDDPLDSRWQHIKRLLFASNSLAKAADGYQSKQCRPPSETEVWLYAKVDGAEIITKGRISKTNPVEPIVYDTRGPPTHWKLILGPR
jgi:hypothetical protein